MHQEHAQPGPKPPTPPADTADTAAAPPTAAPPSEVFNRFAAREKRNTDPRHDGLYRAIEIEDDTDAAPAASSTPRLDALFARAGTPLDKPDPAVDIFTRFRPRDNDRRQPSRGRSFGPA